jgi:hypothetical protein
MSRGVAARSFRAVNGGCRFIVGPPDDPSVKTILAVVTVQDGLGSKAAVIGQSLAVVCGRGSGAAGPERAERVLDRLAAGLVKKNPGATTSAMTLAGTPAIRIDTYDEGKNSMLWHLHVLHGGRTYYLAVVTPPGTGKTPLPRQALDMLRTLEFLR